MDRRTPWDHSGGSSRTASLLDLISLIAAIAVGLAAGRGRVAIGGGTPPGFRSSGWIGGDWNIGTWLMAGRLMCLALLLAVMPAWWAVARGGSPVSPGHLVVPSVLLGAACHLASTAVFQHLFSIGFPPVMTPENRERRLLFLRYHAMDDVAIATPLAASWATLALTGRWRREST